MTMAAWRAMGRGAVSTLLGGAVALGAGRAQAASLCHPGEQIVFACQVKNAGKSVSVCIAGPSVAYRFGKPGALELQYPDNANDQGGAMGVASRFTREDGPFAGGVAHSISFEHQGVSYRVEDRETGARSAKSAAWIEVTRGQTSIAHIVCLKGWTRNWALLEGVVPVASAELAPPSSALAAAPAAHVDEPADAARTPPDSERGLDHR